jgi:hypothetical protein
MVTATNVELATTADRKLFEADMESFEEMTGGDQRLGHLGALLMQFIRQVYNETVDRLETIEKRAAIDHQFTISSLEERIKELEARPAAEWRGVWREDRTYAECNIVTHEGALWMAKRETAMRPGSSGSADDWRMIVKSGRPA